MKSLRVPTVWTCRLAICIAAFHCLPLLAQSSGEWASLHLVNGKTYTQARVIGVEADGLKVIHATGVARLPYESLPEDVRQLFRFDSHKARLAREHRELDARLARAQVAASELAERMRLKTERSRAQAEVSDTGRRGVSSTSIQQPVVLGETARVIRQMLVDRRGGCCCRKH